MLSTHIVKTSCEIERVAVNDKLGRTEIILVFYLFSTKM